MNKRDIEAYILGSLPASLPSLVSNRPEEFTERAIREVFWFLAEQDLLKLNEDWMIIPNEP